MRPFRIRLTLILMVMIGISMAGAGFTMARVFEKSHISALEENMIREIQLLSRTFDFRPTQGGDAMAYYTREARELAALTDSRVTFISKDGTVIGDSESDPRQMDNHSGREEIVDAARKGSGYAIRHSSTLKEDMLYVAVPVVAGEDYDGFIRLSVSLAFVDQGVRKGWTLMAGGLAILFVVAAVVSYRVAAGLTSPWKKSREWREGLRSWITTPGSTSRERTKSASWRRRSTAWPTACKISCKRSATMRTCCRACWIT